MNEHDWDHFDELVQAVAARASVSAGLDDVKIRTKLLRLFEEARQQSLTFDHLSTLTESDTSAREQVCRKISWLLQHALKAKVWCVNARLLSSRADRLYSPVIEQLKRIGLHSVKERLQAFQDHVRRLNQRLHTTVDAVLVSTDYRTVYVVKGCTISSLAGGIEQKRVRQALSVGGETLWDSPDRIIPAPIVDAEACRTLVLAWGVLKDTFNHLDVVPLYCIVDDFSAGWHFQVHDLTGVYWGRLQERKVSLADFPVSVSSLNFLGAMRENSDVFNALPNWFTASPLYCVPPDRPARSLMALDVLHREQAGNAKEIVPVRDLRLAQEVDRQYDLYYTKDMRRHDLLHLTRRGLVAKHPGNTFTITPLGFARFYMAVAMAHGATPSAFAQTALSRVVQQAELVWKHRNL